MHSGAGNTLNLDHYLRLTAASAPLWLATLAHMLGGRECWLQVAAGPFAGRLACLEAAGTRVSVLETSSGASFNGENTRAPAALAVLTGTLSCWTPAGRLLVRPGEGVYLPPLSPVMVEADGPAKMVIVQLPRPLGRPSLPRVAGPAPGPVIHHLLSYLDRARLFRNHRHAEIETCRLGRTVCSAFADCGLLEAQAVPPWQPERLTDRRVERAIACLTDWRETGFDSHRVADMAGVSNRNLYYLMRRHTGMTPYQFYLTRRLIRVREALLNCNCGVSTVAWHAMGEGFGHLGRFSAMYRRHFGENPSDTLQWRDQTLAWASQVVPEDSASGETGFRVILEQ